MGLYPNLSVETIKMGLNPENITLPPKPYQLDKDEKPFMLCSFAGRIPLIVVSVVDVVRFNGSKGTSK